MNVIHFTDENDQGVETEYELPAVWEICDRCVGNGTCDPPEFSNGFTADDFAEDPDFAEEYLRGTYDVRCPECEGSGKILVPDERAAGTPAWTAYQKILQAEARERAERVYQQRYGF